MKAVKWTWWHDRTQGVINFDRDGYSMTWRRGYTAGDAESLCAYLNSRSLL